MATETAEARENHSYSKVGSVTARSEEDTKETAIIATFVPAINPSPDEEILFVFLFLMFVNLLNLIREFARTSASAVLYGINISIGDV